MTSPDASPRATAVNTKVGDGVTDTQYIGIFNNS